MIDTEVLIIGGGAAGLTAAIDPKQPLAQRAEIEEMGTIQSTSTF